MGGRGGRVCGRVRATGIATAGVGVVGAVLAREEGGAEASGADALLEGLAAGGLGLVQVLDRALLGLALEGQKEAGLPLIVHGLLERDPSSAVEVAMAVSRMRSCAEQRSFLASMGARVACRMLSSLVATVVVVVDMVWWFDGLLVWAWLLLGKFGLVWFVYNCNLVWFGLCIMLFGLVWFVHG